MNRFIILFRAVAAASVLGLVAGGCGRSDEPVTITEARKESSTEAMPTDLSTADRFGMRRVPTTLPAGHPPIQPGQMMPGASAPAAAGDASLTWDTPDGWVQTGARPMRVVTFQVGENTECYVAELSGMGGGIEANLNRWRGQLGHAPFEASEFESLPRIAMLGRQTPLLDVTGTYTGMGEVSEADSRLLGAAAGDGRRMFFVKMVGPVDEVAAAREAFVAFCESLTLAGE